MFTVKKQNSVEKLAPHLQLNHVDGGVIENEKLVEILASEAQVNDVGKGNQSKSFP